MPPPDWHEVEEVFQAALDAPAGERAAVVARRCGGDEALRQEVESLLAAEAASDNFLPRSGFLKAVGTLVPAEAEADRAGQRLGAYKLLREVGRGGMGVVYEAARDDGQFSQRVAVKVVKRGIDTEDVLRRFRKERQILASLHHPNIAAVFDGGTTPDGLPYFVMEYVEGEPLTQFCDARAMPTAGRLRLFREVCAAVEHAHRNLVVHRDLKPSNILVKGEGEVRLLDFGVAKLLSPEAEGGRTETRVRRVMTPEYASPEQVRGERVTTATDVYSLGVVLYELLTGARPYGLKGLSGEELSRAICDSEPSKPSRAAASVPAHALRGDVDNIVLKALSKEPAERYGSVGQLSEDIERHLSGLPVRARPATLRYRAAKFVGRNRVAVLAASLVLVAVAAGLVVALWQAENARRQRDAAQRERVKAERINAFLQSFISYADPSWYAAGRDRGGEVRFVEVVNEIAARIDTEFADQPEIRDELHHTVGNTYRGLGRNDLAVAHLRAALDASRAAYGAEHPKVARDLYFLAAGLQLSGDDASAEPLFREAIRMMRATDAGNADLPYMLQDLGGMLVQRGDPAAAEPFLREALEASRRRYGDEHPAVAVSLERPGEVYLARGDLENAEAMFREAVGHQRRASNRQLLSGALLNLGDVQSRKGDYAGAESSLLEALDLARASVGDAHPHTAGIRLRLVGLYEAWGKPARAAQYRAATSGG